MSEKTAARPNWPTALLHLARARVGLSEACVISLSAVRYSVAVFFGVAPTALISWAHRNVGWSEKQAENWTALVVEFAVQLRTSGVDADLDLWHESDTTIDWTRWGQQRIAACDYTLIVLSSAWRQRWEGSNEPTVGAGVAVEADTLKGLFITNQEKFQRRTILIMLPGTTPADIPLDLHRLNRFRIEKIDRNSIEPLIRALSNQPRYAVPELGFIPVLPPVSETDKGDPIDLPAIRHELQTAELALTTSPNDDAGEASRAQLRRRISRARGTLRGLGEAVPSPLAGPDTTSVDDETEKQDRSHSSEQSAILNHSPRRTA